MFNGIFNQTNLLEKGLDAAWKKNEVIANNIANSDTTNFKASHVEFESVFRDLLESDSNSFFSSNESSTVASPSGELTSDDELQLNIVQDGDSSQINGNSVDLDSEMSELAQNSILYNTLSYSVNKELARIKTILNEGR